MIMFNLITDDFVWQKKEVWYGDWIKGSWHVSTMSSWPTHLRIIGKFETRSFSRTKEDDARIKHFKQLGCDLSYAEFCEDNYTSSAIIIRFPVNLKK